MNEVVAVSFAAMGAVFTLLAAVGIVRMPDLFTRMQTATKATTLGVACVMLAAAVHFGDLGTVVRAVLIIGFLFFTAPVAAHAVGRAAYFDGVPLWHGSEIDELRERYERVTHRLRSQSDVAGRVGRAAPHAMTSGGIPQGEDDMKTSSRPRVRPQGARFERILVYGVPPHDAPILLRQAIPIVTPGKTVIRLLEPSAASQLVRIGVEPLDQIVDSLTRLRVPVRRETADVATVDEIVQLAIRGKHDLVLKAISAERPQRTLTQIDLALVRQCPCPVWFVECAEPRPPRRIVAAIDPEADEAARRVLAHRVAVAAKALAATMNADLHLFHAWVAFGDQLLRNRMSAADLDEYVGAAYARAQQSAAHILEGSELDLRPGHVHFRKGEFNQALPGFLEEGDFDLVVMGTRGRTGWLDSIIRPHAESVLVHTRVSVLVVSARQSSPGTDFDSPTFPDRAAIR
jgi:multicomponent Na+:H+ antiporter subunit G